MLTRLKRKSCMIESDMQTNNGYLQACRKRRLAARNDRSHLGSPMLRIDIRNMNATAVLRCTGRLVFGVEAETLRGVTKARPERDIRVDLQNVRTIDASGLGVMVELQHWAKNNHRTLVYSNPCDMVERLIRLTRLHTVLSVEYCEAGVGLGHDSEQRAMIA